MAMLRNGGSATGGGRGVPRTTPLPPGAQNPRAAHARVHYALF
jgi:hypothetical protein